jgi:hypothetical protein
MYPPYINSNGKHYSFSHSIPILLESWMTLYVGFYSNINSCGKEPAGGHKFLKLFGWIDSNDYANTTFGQTYQKQVRFGKLVMETRNGDDR